MVTVKSVERLTPKSVRVTFGGPELAGFTNNGPATHLKVMFARPGESKIDIPEWGPEGPILREGQSYPPSRTYTPRFWRPEVPELVVDFMLHGEGLASTWAQTVKAGDESAVSAAAGGPTPSTKRLIGSCSPPTNRRYRDYARSSRCCRQARRRRCLSK